MNGVFAFLFLIGTASAQAAFEIPDFETNCARLFLNVPGSILFDDPFISSEIVSRLGIFQGALTALLRRPGYSFSTNRTELAEFREFLEPDHSLSRPQIEAIQSALIHLKALILFQSDLSSEYENWVGKIELKKDKPMPHLRLLSDNSVDRKNNTIGGKTLESWKAVGAPKAWERINSDMLAQRDIPHAPHGPHTSHEDLDAHHARVPEAFMTWIRAHAEMADFYRIPRSPVYYELVAELDIAYAESVAH